MSYTKEFKKKAVAMATKKGAVKKDVAKKMGVSYPSLLAWMKQPKKEIKTKRAGAMVGLASHKKIKEENLELRSSITLINYHLDGIKNLLNNLDD